MHQSVLTRICLVLAVFTLIAVNPVQAQYEVQRYRGSGNTKIGTVGDATLGKFQIKAGIQTYLSYGTLGLFGDADYYVPYDAPDVFAFPLPDYSDKGYDFSDMSFDEYLTFVANSYKLSSSAEYLLMFYYQNAPTLNDDYLFFYSESLSNEFYTERASVISELLDYYGVDSIYDMTYDQYYEYSYYLNQELYSIADDLESQAYRVIHEEDFLAGGGYFPLDDDPIIPGDVIDGNNDGFDPLDPIFTPITPASASESEVTSTIIPEPATLGLLAFGLGGVLIRRR